MSEVADENDPVRISDHDLNDLVSTVNALVSESRQQGETLSRVAEEQPSREDDGAGGGTAPASGGGASNSEQPSTPFILALEGGAYAEELAALKTWVHDLLLPVYGREITSSRPWCTQWTEHSEAIARLHALWLAWQQYTDVEAGLGGPSMWHRDHLDPSLAQLRAPDGPFGACTTSPTRRNHRLLPSPAPTGDGS